MNWNRTLQIRALPSAEALMISANVSRAFKATWLAAKKI